MDPDTSRFYSLMAGVGTRGFADEYLLHLAGFVPFELSDSPEDGELWEDPEDLSKDGGRLVGRWEALRRIRVRQSQGWLVIYPPESRPEDGERGR